MERFSLQLQTCASIWSSMWGTNIKLDPTCINCGSSVIKTAELKSHEMLHTGKSLSNAIFLENISIQPASYIVIFLLRFYVLSRRNDLRTLGEKKSCKKVQPMRLLNLWGGQFEDAFDGKHSGEKSNNCSRYRYAFSQPDNLRTHLITYRGGDHTNVTSVTMHSLVQAIWVTHLKHIVENSRTNATSMKMHHLMEAI